MTEKRFILRIPNDLNLKLEKRAKENNRSKNAEIITLLVFGVKSLD